MSDLNRKFQKFTGLVVNVEKLIKMITDKSEVSFRGASTSEFLTCILSDIALNANNANNFSISYFMI